MGEVTDEWREWRESMLGLLGSGCDGAGLWAA